MVCDRCKMAVISELEKHGIDFRDVELGEVFLKHQPSITKLEAFKAGIENLGFELIGDRKSKLIEKLKQK